MGLDPEFIIKQGYLVKSPPLDESSFIRRRWRLRWFVLYDNGKEDVHLYYFTNELMNRLKGKISLVGSEIYKQRGKLHGYNHVINIQTTARLYHLCSTQETVHEDWLDKIRDHYIPNTEVRRRLSELETSLCKPNPIIMVEGKKALERTISTQSNRSIVSNSDDEVDYRSMMADPSPPDVEYESYTNKYLDHNESKCFTLPYKLDSNKKRTSQNPIKLRPYSNNQIDIDAVYDNITLPCASKQHRDNVYENVVPDLVDFKKRSNTIDPLLTNSYNRSSIDTHSDGNDDTYISMIPEESAGELYVSMGVETEKQSAEIEFEDEGIGRSGSDSSTTSTASSNANSNTSSSYLEQLMTTSSHQTSTFQYRSNRHSTDTLLLGFVGPKIAKPTTDKTACRIAKARSVGDLLCPVPPPRTSSLGKREGNI